MTIEEAKQRLRIPALWARLDLPGSPKLSCKSPFREDQHASFSVSADGLLFNDFATGEAGDAVDFLRIATGLSPEAAFRKFIELAGGSIHESKPLPERPAAAPQARQKPVFPAFEHGTDEDLHALADLRKLSFAACFLARSVRLLRFGTWKDKAAWIGAGLQIRSGPDRTARGNLYIIPSGESASGKSSAFDIALLPFVEFHNERKERWKTEVLPGLETDKETLEDDIEELRRLRKKADDEGERGELRSRLERKKAELKEIEARLHPPKLYTQDVTSQTLGPLLQSQPGECLASLSADARELADIWLGKYNAGKGTDENFYVQAWTGDAYESDRTTRGNVSLKRPCLAGLWLMQKDKLEDLFAERSLLEGGHLARMLTCHTDCRPQKIGSGGKPIPADVSEDYRELLRGLLESFRLAAETRTIEPSPEAMAAFNAHFDAIVDRWESGEVRDVSSFALRWTEQAWRLAVCIHAGAWGRLAHERRLELVTARAAIELADWFAGQQLAILSGGRHKARRKVRDEVLALLMDSPKGIRGSDVYRARIARDAEAAHSLLATMEGEGELTGRDEQPEGGGHVTRIYTRARK